VHPIERLRFVARAQGVPGAVLASEAAGALMSFGGDPAALVAACRRVLSRQVSCGPLWWVCSRLLTAEDVREAARECIRALESDTTGVALSLALDLREIDPDPSEEDLSDDDPGGPGALDGPDRPVLVPALAAGEGGAIVSSAGWAAVQDAPDRAECWLVGGVGVRLSDPMWASLVEHQQALSRRDEELVPTHVFSHWVGPDGPVPLRALGPPDCPVAPELFRLVG
jgi:hypothetical protein